MSYAFFQKSFGNDKIKPGSINAILSRKSRTSSENIQSIFKSAVQIFRDVITRKCNKTVEVVKGFSEARYVSVVCSVCKGRRNPNSTLGGPC